MADTALRVVKDQATGDVILQPAAPAVHRPADGAHFGNLAPLMGKGDLDQLSGMLTEHITYDQQSRDEWDRMAKEYVELLGIGPESRPDMEAGDDSDTSDHPLLLTALTRYQSKGLSSLLPSADQICRYKCAYDLDMIEDEEERERFQNEVDAAGRRVVKYYTNYLTEQVPAYSEDTDMILYESGLFGLGLRKIYNDMTRSRGKTRVERVRGQDLLLSYDTTNWRCGRYTHQIDISTPELIRALRKGIYRPVSGMRDGSAPRPDPITEAQDRIRGLTGQYMQGGEGHRIYEVYIDLFLDADPHPDGLARPYIVTIHNQSQEILAIQRCWRQGDEEEQRVERFVGYIFHPGVNAVSGLGLGAILGGITRSLRKAQRAGLDAAYYANHPSGFKLSSFSIRNDATRIKNGEFIDVEASVDDIRKALMLHPFQGPAQGLLALSEKMENNGRELGGIAALDLSQLMKAGIAAGPAMAAYEESTEFQSAIHRRLYDAHATELRLIHQCMKEAVGRAPVSFGVNGHLKEGDLTLVEVLPFMKPGQTSRQKEILEAQAMWEFASSAPDIADRRKAGERFVRALGNPDNEDLLLPDPTEEPPAPMDPASEYAAILAGKPVRAAPQQNHQAHIDAHAAQMRGLQLAQLPVEKGDAAAALLSAHIAEHMGMQMIVGVAAKTGIPVEQLGENMAPEVEARLAPAVAQAVVAIEQERAAAAQPAQQDSRLEVEKIKQQGALQKGAMEQRHERELEQLKHRHAMELQGAKDSAAMDREEADNDAAITIARMKGNDTPSGDAGARSTVTSGAQVKPKAGV